jgi:hypothetical protein
MTAMLVAVSRFTRHAATAGMFCRSVPVVRGERGLRVRSFAAAIAGAAGRFLFCTTAVPVPGVRRREWNGRRRLRLRR